MAIKLTLIFAVCLNGILQSNAQDQQILNNLTDDQFRKLFHRQKSELPNFQTVNVKTTKKSRFQSDVRPVQFEIDGEKRKLRLTPIERNVIFGDIPLWTVHTDNQKPSGHSYQKVDRKDVEIGGTFYQDSDKNAMLLAYYKDQYIHYNGVFGEHNNMKVIRSVPEEWWAEPGSEFYRKHVVYDVKEAQSGTKLVVDNSNNIITRRLAEPIQTLYPKLLIVVESNLFKELGEDVSETFKYVATFWNAVNLKYSTLTSPKVHILITGIIIAKDDTALRYIYDARNETNMNEINHIQMLNACSNYYTEVFKTEVDFQNYDSTFTMAKLNAGSVLGSAYPGRICSSRLNTGWVRDDVNYYGLFPATHELGHLLNLPHDGMDAANDCALSIADGVGTIMAPYLQSIDKSIWSDCSKRILSDFASMEAAQCMATKNRN